MPISPWWLRDLVVVLLGAHTIILLDCARQDFVTYDEAGNIPAGIFYWQSGDYSLSPVNPPLPKMLAVLPVLLLHLQTEALPRQRIPPGDRPESSMGARFAEDNAGPYRAIVWLGRLAGIGWSLLGGWAVFCWARDSAVVGGGQQPGRPPALSVVFQRGSRRAGQRRGPPAGLEHRLGQDLYFLKKWLEEHADAHPVSLAYFNSVDAQVVELQFQAPPLGLVIALPEDPSRDRTLDPVPGYHAVCVRLVYGSSGKLPDGEGGWVHAPLHGYEYFRNFRPVTKAGYSIFI